MGFVAASAFAFGQMPAGLTPGKEIQGSTPLPTLTARAAAPFRELKQFQELVKRNCAELAYCEGIATSTKHFAFSKLPVFSTKVTERFNIGPVPISKDGVATETLPPARAP